jgi:arylsulfatase
VTRAGTQPPDPFAPASPAPADPRADGLRARLRDANVMLVILDAARAHSMSAYGYARPTTPQLERLASEGVLFERAYTPAVFTLSAMASLWTSRLPLEHHAGIAHDAPLPSSLPTLAERLNAHGIVTAGFIANSMAGPAFGLARGFEQFEEVHLEHGANAPALTRRVQAWLGTHDPGQRFFLYVHYREPHFPYDPPAPYATAFGPDAPLPQRAKLDPAWYGAVNDGEHELTPAEREHLVRLYDGNLASVDAQLGRLREALAQTRLLERTLVIVAADHGEALHEHGWIGHNQQVFEESTKVPLVLRWPEGAAGAGQRVASLVDLLDVAPTVVDAFGLRGRDPALDAFHGRSLLDVAAGAEGRALTWATSTGEWQAFGLRHEHFKYLRNVRHGVERLFELQRDPTERHDLLAAQPVRAAFYRQGLQLALLRAAQAAQAPARPAQLSAKQLENLRALGYVQ